MATNLGGRLSRGPPHVRFGSKADIQRRLTNVCFTPKSGHWFSVSACPPYANRDIHDWLRKPFHGRTPSALSSALAAPLVVSAGIAATYHRQIVELPSLLRFVQESAT